MSIIFDESLIKKAYKKLKSNVYYDKYSRLLMHEIVKAEMAGDHDKYFHEILIKMNSNSNEDWNDYVNSLLKSIGCVFFPKKLCQNNSMDNNVVISNYREFDKIEVEIQAFISAALPVHILGMLWIFWVGIKLDRKLNYCYANRINEKVCLDRNEDISWGPHLFKPYFKNYGSWRDTALNMARCCVDNNEDVIICTLDIQRYFYSVNITKGYMNNLLETIGISETADLSENELILWRLHDFVFKVLVTYSQKYYERVKFTVNDKPINNMLPIGFLPSGILSNCYLQQFDNAVCGIWHPLYYGRYVDDILILDRVCKDSDVYKKLRSGNMECMEILSARLHCISDNAGDNKLFDIYKDCIKLSRCNFHAEDKSELKIQMQKLRIFYYAAGMSKATLEALQNEIRRNSSEFRKLPENARVVFEDDYREIYEMYQKGINKLRDIDGLSVDKYKLSKYLGKYFRLSTLLNDHKQKKFIKDFDKIFQADILIENYILWEKLFTIAVINEEYDEFFKLYERICAAISKIKYMATNEDNDDREVIEDDVNKDLKRYLRVVMTRALALTDGNKFEQQRLKYISSYALALEKLKIDSGQYIDANMAEKSAFAISCVGCMVSSDKRFNLFDYQQALEHIKIVDDSRSRYFPYRIKELEINIFLILKYILNGKKYDFSETFNLYNFYNYSVPGTKYEVEKKNDRGKWPVQIGEFAKGHVFKVKSEQRSKLCVALSNVRTSGHDVEECLRGHSNRSCERYRNFCLLVNTAIREHADIIVLPELYLPFEWLETLARACEKNQIAAIVGLEYVVNNCTNEAYNLTAIILPYENNEYCHTGIFFHFKNFPAPNEKTFLENYNKILRSSSSDGNVYELYGWHNVWFSVYCCYELTSIIDRSIFQAYADIVFAVEYNKDVNYFANIVESLVRDLHCYCVQVNNSQYGDSRIIRPTKTIDKDIVQVSGGENAAMLIGTLNIDALRYFQAYNRNETKINFKPLPPGFDKEVVIQKIEGNLMQYLNSVHWLTV